MVVVLGEEEEEEVSPKHQQEKRKDLPTYRYIRTALHSFKDQVYKMKPMQQHELWIALGGYFDRPSLW